MSSVKSQAPTISNNPNEEKTWIQAYPSISGKEFSLDVVGSEWGDSILGYEEDWADLDRGGNKHEQNDKRCNDDTDHTL